MGNRFYKPTTPGRRCYSVASFEEVTTNEPEKSLVVGKMSKAGRNNLGRITIRHRGAGVKKLYRIIDFRRKDRTSINAVVASIEYDPNRTSYIALLHYTDGVKRYIISPLGLKVGDNVICDEKAPLKLGNRLKLKNIPTALEVHDIEIKPGKGGQVVRSAGTAARVVSLDGDFVQIQMPSGDVKYFDKESYATIGRVSNPDHSLITIGKAGRKRWMGRRPEVLGKSMNPVDHPHGGGEGHCPIGLKYPKTPWGLPALGVKTRRKKKYGSAMIVSKGVKKS